MFKPWELGGGGGDNSWSGSGGGNGFTSGGGGFFGFDSGGFFDVGDPITGGMSGEAVFRSLGVLPVSSADYPRYAAAQRAAERAARNSYLAGVSAVDPFSWGEGVNDMSVDDLKLKGAVYGLTAVAFAQQTYFGLPVWFWVLGAIALLMLLR
jgi:hypothetical protein